MRGPTSDSAAIGLVQPLLAMARLQERVKAATLPSRSCVSVPGTELLQRRIGSCRLEDCTFDSFELLYSGAVDKIKSHKSNLNLSELKSFMPSFLLHLTFSVGKLLNAAKVRCLSRRKKGDKCGQPRAGRRSSCMCY